MYEVPDTEAVQHDVNDYVRLADVVQTEAVVTAQRKAQAVKIPEDVLAYLDGCVEAIVTALTAERDALRASNARLRAALEGALYYIPCVSTDDRAQIAFDKARAALAGEAE
jgi:hypothetical protein